MCHQNIEGGLMKGFKEYLEKLSWAFQNPDWKFIGCFCNQKYLCFFFISYFWIKSFLENCFRHDFLKKLTSERIINSLQKETSTW